MCWEAINQDPHAFSHVPDKFVTEEMCLKVIQGGYYYIPKRYQTLDICIEMVRNDILTLFDIKTNFIDDVIDFANSHYVDIEHELIRLDAECI